jgi:hypothetical protein
MNEIPPVSRIGAPRRWPWAVGAVVVAGALAWGATHWVRRPIASPVAPVGPSHVMRSSPPPRSTAAPTLPGVPPAFGKVRATDQRVANYLADRWSWHGVMTLANTGAPSVSTKTLATLPAPYSVHGLASAVRASMPTWHAEDPALTAADVTGAATTASDWALAAGSNTPLRQFLWMDGPASFDGTQIADSYVAPLITANERGVGSFATGGYVYREWVTLPAVAHAVVASPTDTAVVWPAGQTVTAAARVAVTLHQVLAVRQGTRWTVGQYQQSILVFVASITAGTTTRWYVVGTYASPVAGPLATYPTR